MPSTNFSDVLRALTSGKPQESQVNMALIEVCLAHIILTVSALAQLVVIVVALEQRLLKVGDPKALFLWFMCEKIRVQPHSLATDVVWPEAAWGTLHG